MRKFYIFMLAAIASLLTVSALAQQQLPDPGFESWTKTFSDTNDGSKPQPTNWNASNVVQSALGIEFRFNFIERESGHTGSYCAKIADREVGAAGITEAAPGYFTLGTTWQYLDGLNVSEATAGTFGGISFTSQPDSMEVWIKRTGDHWKDEDFHILFYSWKGTSQASSYQGKNGNCTVVTSKFDGKNEESDIRQALDANKCGTQTMATQVAEGWLRDRQEYGEWTKITVPIYYMSDEKPEMCNVIFSAGNYPNFRANSGLYKGNSLYVDDVRLIYSSKIDHLFIGGKEWKGFNPNTTEEQVYSAGKVSSIPEVYGVRGMGKLTNARGASANFNGRRLTSSEMTIKQQGAIDGDPMIIEVKSAEGQTMTYKIKFVSVQSSNARLSSISINDEPLSTFNAYLGTYNVELPYGTTTKPVVKAEKAEDAQTVNITQPTSTSGTSTITVTAQDGKTTMTYTLNFSVAKLSDNTLKSILVDGTEIAGYLSTKRNYTVELPLGTTEAPKVTWVSAYKTGEQTISLVSNTLNGGAQISVKAPGNAKENIYKITYKITASTYSYLSDIKVGGKTVDDFNPERKDYYITLPMGTTTMPKVEYTQGDKYQTVSVDNGGLDGVTKITVTAASGAQTIYRINVSVLKSSNTQLKAIYLDGALMTGFDPAIYDYQIALGTGATSAPKITYEAGDSYQKVEVRDGGLTGTSRLIVTAGDGSTQAYTIKYSVTTSSVNTLKMIYVGGAQLAGFNASTLEYYYSLPQGTTTLPAVTFDKGDAAQTVTARTISGLTGDYKLVVKPQSGATQTYIIHFSLLTSSNVYLKNIYLDGQPLQGFAQTTQSYNVTLPMGTTALPKITWDAGDSSQRVILTDGALNGQAAQLRVIAGDGSSFTYSLSFTVPVAGVSTLLDIKLDGQTISGFSPDKTEYTIVLEQGTTVLPQITYTQNDEYQTVRKTEGGINGDTRIVVRAQNGSTTTYIIHFSVNKSTNVNLAGISLGGKPLAGFEPTRLEYDTVLPSSVARVPSVTYTKVDPSQQVTVQNGSFSTPTTLRVVAEDGTEQTYIIRFSQQHSENAYLNMIYLDSIALAGFQSSHLEYQYNLSLEATRCPVITVDKNEGQLVSITTPALTGTASILVQPETGDPNIYTIRFTQAASTNSQLKSILLDGQTIAGWNPEVTEYEVVTTALPTITYETADEYQRVSMIEGGFADKTYIKVMAADDTYTLYIISFEQQMTHASETTLSMITVDGQKINGFSPYRENYTVQLADGETDAPLLMAQKKDETETVIITQPAETGTAKIDVTAGNLSTKTYEVRINGQVLSGSALQGILVDGVELSAFQPEQHHYTIALPAGTTAVPTLEAVKADAQQTVVVTNLSLTDWAKIEVTGQDGSQTLYTIGYEVAKSTDAQLSDLRIGGISLVDFAADKYDYDILLPLGTAQLPEVDAVPNQEGQTITLTLPYRDGTGTILVIAEDGVTQNTYTLNVTAEVSKNAELRSLVVNGVEQIVANQFDYQIDIPAYSVPMVAYTEGEQKQTIGFVDNGAQGATIIVTAEDGVTRNVYNITYNEQPNSDALLSDIKVFNGSQFESVSSFSEQTTEYEYSLQWRTLQVPAIWAVAHAEGQTIEIAYGAVNERTTITVTAQDGVTKKDYYIDFPVQKSSNTMLEDVSCDIADVDFVASEQQFLIELPYGTTVAPMLYYKKQEQEQRVIYTYAPLGEVSKMEVIAENGDTRTYEFVFEVFKSDKPNTLPLVNVNGIGYVLGEQSAIDVALPYGTTEFSVDVPLKNYDEQTYEILNGGLYHPTTIVVYPHRSGEAERVYTINPKLDTTYPTSLTDIQIDGASLAGFEPTKHVYIISVTDAPAVVTGTLYQADMSIDNEAIATQKQRRIIVEDPNGVYATSEYDIFFYYPNDLNFDLGFNNFDNVTNTLKGAGLMDMSSMAREAVSLIDCDNTEIVIGNFKDDTHTGTTPHNWNSPITAETTGLKNKADMGYIKISTKPCWLTLVNLKIETFIGSVIDDYDPENYVKRITSPKQEGQYAVQLSTKYLTTSAESMPGVLSLSSQTVKIGMWMLEGTLSIGDVNEMLKAASSPSSLAFGEPITFRNSPDKFSVQVKPQSHNKISGWQVKYIVNGTDVLGYIGSYASTNWVTVEKDLPYNDNPQFLDIRINSANSENPQDMYVASDGQTASNRYTSTLVVDDIQLLYRSDLTGLQVNGIDATMSGTDFTVDLNADDYYGIPTLTFLTGVPDQMQQVVWNSDYTEATITNIAEDLTTQTVYTLRINQTQSADNTLQKVLLDGVEWTTFSPSTTEYTIRYDLNQPSLQVVLNSIRATAALSRTDDKTTIIVTAENGDTKEYTFTYEKNMPPISDDAQFTATRIASTDDQLETFVLLEKNYDAQTIVFDETLGTITCTASDLNATSEKQIADFIIAPAAEVTSAQLTALGVEDLTFADFDKAQYSYSAAQGSMLSFSREYPTDKVIETITDDKTTIAIVGSGAATPSDNAQQTYTIETKKPTTDNAYLETILVNGVPLASFYESDEEYTIDDLTAKIQPVLAEDGQTVSIVYQAGQSKKTALSRKRAPMLDDGILGTYIVTTHSSDLSATHEIRVFLRKPAGSDTRLAVLALAGYNLTPVFSPTTYQYEVQIPTAEPKTEDVMMPGLTAIAADEGQTVTIENNGLNATSYIIVRAENGDEQQYDLTVNMATSTYNDLDVIDVNGMSVALQSGVYEYDVVLSKNELPVVDAYTRDVTATIDKAVSMTQAIVLVTAENGDIRQYTLNFTLDPSLADARLKSIGIEGKEIDGFDADQSTYDIALPYGTKTLPIINIVKRYDSQQVVVYPGGVTGQTIIEVTSADGNEFMTYTLNFSVLKSNNCYLKNIAIDYEMLPGFSSHQQTYTVELLSSNFEVQVVRGDEGQTVSIDTDTDGRIFIDVTSEDESCTTIYTIDYSVYQCNLSTLHNILLDGVALSSFSPSRTDYIITLPVGQRTIPDISTIAACDGQLIERDIQEIGKPSTITVTSADGENKTTYTLSFLLQLSQNSELEMITADGEMLEGFRPDLLYYEFYEPVGTRRLPELSYQVADPNATVEQTVVYETTYRRDTRFRVVAEDGKSERTYAVIYNVNRSSVDTLAMIYLDDVPMQDFSGTKNNYNVLLPIGATTMPQITADKGDPYQSEPRIRQTSLSDIAATYEIYVLAEDSTHRTYTVTLQTKLSEETTLRSINVNGVPIEVNGMGYTGNTNFSPEQTNYTLLWAVGTDKNTIPQIEAIAGDQYQRIDTVSRLTSLEGVAQFNVTAQNGDMQTYIVRSLLLHSSVDTLDMITIDGIDIEGFRGQTNQYSIDLPLGVNDYPQIGYEQAEPWQTVTGPKLVASTSRSQTYTLTVTAENGNRRTYTITFNIVQSGNDRLQMIYLDNQLLQEFEESKNYYNIELPHGTTTLPKVTWDEGDQWQTQELVMGQLPGETYITVTAQAGNTRTYTLNFTVAKSSESHLSMIYLDGQALAGFDEDQTQYSVELPYGTLEMPKVTYDKKEQEQTVNQKTSVWQQEVTVTAEDGTTVTIYTLTFTIAKSSNALLQDLTLDGTTIEGFHAEVFDYEIELPAGTTVFPLLGWTTGDDEQTINAQNEADGYSVEVTAGDETTVNTYTIVFTIAPSDENRLRELNLGGLLLDGFDPDTMIYTIEYPIGTKVQDLPTISDLSFVTMDADATAQALQQDSVTLTVLVTAANGSVRVYVVNLEILLSDNSLLQDLRVGGYTINGFNPTTLTYTYTLYEGQLPAEVEAEAQDTAATVDITMGNVGEKTYIYCTAEDGSETIYTILFAVTNIQSDVEPNAGSCVFSHIAGTMQYRAVTICNNVQCAIYDISGRLLLMQDVPKVNPNMVEVGLNSKGEQVIYGVSDNAEGAIFDIPLAQPQYFFVFFQDGRKITSGKFSLQQ